MTTREDLEKKVLFRIAKILFNTVAITVIVITIGTLFVFLADSDGASSINCMIALAIEYVLFRLLRAGGLYIFGGKEAM